MGQIVATIIPIFSLVALGNIARRRGFLPEAFMGPANRLVYYLAIPAMIFRAIAKASLTLHFNPIVLGLTLAAIVALFAVCWCTAILLQLPREIRAAFIQCSFHGNLGYIGLAVAFYYLGGEGLARTSIMAAFIMILQNFLAVVTLQAHSRQAAAGGRTRAFVAKIVGNPVIVSALVGIFFSLTGFPVPLVLDRSLQILGGLALPMALLIIGGSLSMTRMRKRLAAVAGACFFKLLLLPAIGFGLFRLAGQASADWLPAIILLASPTATIAYVMAREMNADADFAVAAISATTLFSAATFVFWLSVG
ncbi:AEC family transporter [uncultured Desulfosarcina sp.]|uniref:AEC family transporter n=1 Tax=uncultured Desulfosarcina sp. TaxID=218289 RepID=UPI0029C684A9|nr:AEC family transporter [uncultured Desulfosarcina sp.]